MRLLHSDNSSIVILTQAGQPCIRYIGPRLASTVTESELRCILSEPLPNGA
ncbi:MAG: hypothetical protein ACI9K8_001262, partial [Reinekea sp.]